MDLDANLKACVLLHLTPADLASVSTPPPSSALHFIHLGEIWDFLQVTQTCSDLRHETESEVVWCTLFLRRFGSDFWGEATIGPHPYTVRLLPHIDQNLVHRRLTCHRAGGQSVPERANAWLEHPISDLFARFSLRSERESEGENGESDDEDEDGIGHAAALREFVRSHATRDGYGGWKQAYRRYACVCVVCACACLVARSSHCVRWFMCGGACAVLCCGSQHARNGDRMAQARRLSIHPGRPSLILHSLRHRQYHQGRGA